MNYITDLNGNIQLLKLIVTKFKHTNSQGVEITLGDFPEKNNLIITTIFNGI